jgi:hypothetical protein
MFHSILEEVDKGDPDQYLSNSGSVSRASGSVSRRDGKRRGGNGNGDSHGRGRGKGRDEGGQEVGSPVILSLSSDLLSRRRDDEGRLIDSLSDVTPYLYEQGNNAAAAAAAAVFICRTSMKGFPTHLYMYICMCIYVLFP